MRFMSLKWSHPDFFLGHRLSSLAFWIGTALLGGLFYLAVSWWGFGFVGFPLDDAWIHQTYARNLARSGQLAFTPGLPSAGSTAPLWTLLLSIGYLVRIPYLIWSYGLGLVFLGLTGWTMARLGRRLFPEKGWLALLIGLFVVFEWHLVWAAVSGMETILFVWLSAFLVERYLAYQADDILQRPRASFGLGIVGGMLILTRPEGVGLVGLIGLDMVYRQGRRLFSTSLAGGILALGRSWIWLAAGTGLLLVPYVGFHLWLTGLPFPNTFYAKQAEYGLILENFSVWQRLFGSFGPAPETVQGVFRVIFIGPQLLLLPGLFFGAWLIWRERRFSLILIWLWWISYLLLYGLRLPVTYQHGRYQIPAIAWVILLGVWGTARLLEALPNRDLLGRVAGRAWGLSLVVLVVAFVGIGAQAYGRDVRVIESEMVTTARWLNRHVEDQAVIAAHDIGAIGYFTERRLIDLAGLVTPELIPFIRDEAALFDFMIARQVDYLVTFPSWYPELTRNPGLILIYRTGAPWAPQAGGDNMAVYRIKAGAKP